MTGIYKIYSECLIVVLLSFVEVTSLQIKIGIILDNSSDYHRPPSFVSVFGRHNFTAELIYRRINTSANAFTITQIGSALLQEGAISVLMISGAQTIHNDLDWVLPVTGFGELDAPELPDQDGCPNHVQTLPPSVLKLARDGERLSKILLSTLDNIKWRKAILIYEDRNDHLSSCFPDDLSKKGLFFTMYKIHRGFTAVDIYHLLLDVYETLSVKRDVLNIVVCGSDTMERLMAEANVFDEKRMRETALFYKSRWLLFHTGNSPLTDVTYMSNMINVAIINIPPELSSIDIPNYMTIEYLLKAMADDCFVLESINDDQCLNKASAIRMFEDIRNISQQIRQSYGHSVVFPIKTLMFQKTGRAWSDVGSSTLTGDVELTSDIFPNVRFGLNGKSFIVSTLPYPPFEYQVNGTWRGYCIEVLNEIKRMLNFTHEITFPSDGEWGRLLNNGSWTGLVGQLQRRDVDLTVAPLSVQEERERVMDFTLGFYYDSSVIIMKRPDPKETQWRRIIEPLRWEVIVLTGSFIPIISIILYLLEHINPFNRVKPGIHRLFEHLWYAYGCVFMQGGQNLPRSQTERTVICIWWIFCIILGATYCGNLIAYLTVNKQTPPFDSLATMVEQKEYEWGTQGGTYWETWFEQGSMPTLVKVWNGLKEFNKTDPRVLSTSLQIHMDKVKTGKYAYIADKSALEIEASKNCDLYIAEEEFLPLQYGIGLPNNSPYTKVFSDLILNMHETGLMKIWKQKEWPKQSFCSGSLLNEPKAITWIDIQIAFYFLGIGICLSAIIILIEFCVVKFNKQKSLPIKNGFGNSHNGSFISTTTLESRCI